RGSHEFRLTAAGKLAYDAAKQIHVQTQNLRTQLTELQSQKVELRVGMIDSLANLLFVQSDELHNLEAHTHLSLTIDNSDRLTAYVLHDELDMALITSTPELPAALLPINLGQEPLVVVAHHSLAATVEKQASTGTLANFLSYNQNSHTYRLVLTHFARLGVKVDYAFYSTSPEIMLELVLHKRGVAALPYMLIQPQLQSGKLVPIHIKGSESCCIARTIVSVHRSGRSLPNEAGILLAKTQAKLTGLMLEASNL
ncbi:MAG TPA: substrate-binding domain-containing protein, partial [Candidatus Saccharimonadales bacterium]